MKQYLNKPMAELAGELAKGLLRLRKGYVDAAEGLLTILDDSQEYPLEFIVFKLTGFQPRRTGVIGTTIPGPVLRSDLCRLMLHVSSTFDLRAGDYDEPSYDIDSAAARFSVSTKTIQRWRRDGLAVRRLVFSDGHRGLGVLESSVRWFIEQRRRQARRSLGFARISPQERQDIIRRSRRMARFSRCSLSDIARRIAVHTGRATETIRYTIRQHDRDNPQQAVCPQCPRPLDAPTKTLVYRCLELGVSASELAQRYGRTRGSIYRIAAQVHARQLLARPIQCIYHPQFDLPGAEEMILCSQPPELLRPVASDEIAVRPPAELPPYLRALYDVPLLTPQQEKDLFRRYNFLKFSADRLRKAIDLNRVRAIQLQQIERLLSSAQAVKNQIVRANLRLVVSISRRHAGGPQRISELISDGNVVLMGAVESFDFSRPSRFSTYASWAITRSFARTVGHEQYQLDRFVTGTHGILAAAAPAVGNGEDWAELRESIEALLGQLSGRERAVLVDHFGLAQGDSPRTLEEVGSRLGLSGERVRQIKLKALGKLRRIIEPQGLSG